MKDVAGYDMAIQAIGGLMSITGESDDKPGGPQKVGVPIVDILTGMYSAAGVISALLHRERTGEGQHIDMALLDVQVAVLANQNLNFLTTGTPPKRFGNAHPNIVPYQSSEPATVPSCSPLVMISNSGSSVQLLV
jgi:formyl-CoA transferase